MRYACVLDKIAILQTWERQSLAGRSLHPDGSQFEDARDFDVVMDEEIDRERLRREANPTPTPDPVQSTGDALGPGVKEFREKIK